MRIDVKAQTRLGLQIGSRCLIFRRRLHPRACTGYRITIFEHAILSIRRRITAPATAEPFLSQAPKLFCEIAPCFERRDVDHRNASGTLIWSDSPFIDMPLSVTSSPLRIRWRARALPASGRIHRVACWLRLILLRLSRGQSAQRACERGELECERAKAGQVTRAVKRIKIRMCSFLSADWRCLSMRAQSQRGGYLATTIR
jgi:hypothetical protein